MTIATSQQDAVGARIYLPEGPFGAAGGFQNPSFKPGRFVEGDAEGRFCYCLFAPTASVTLNQGDWMVYDQNYYAVQSATGASAHAFGAACGTFFLGGITGALASPTSGALPSFSATFTPGVYGIWVQTNGCSIINCATVTAQKPLNTTAVAGQANAPSTALANSMGISNAYPCVAAATFTATTVTGSAILTAVSSTKGYAIGQKITGSGIPSSTVIKDIQGSTVTVSNAATASASGVTMTTTLGLSDCTTTNGSAVLTNVTSISGIYPNATIAGTGIPASTTIVSIGGTASPYTITMSANATATANNIALTASVYIEGMLRNAFIGVQN